MVKVALCRFQQSLGAFTMFVVEDTSKMGFYRHSFNHVFRRRYFGKYIGYEEHLLVENVQNLIVISKMQRKIQKKSFVSQIIVSELVALNILYKEDNNCHRRSMCKQTVLRFSIALT